MKVEPGCPTVSFDGLHLPGWQSVIINIHQGTRRSPSMLITTYALVTSNRSIQSSSCVKANTLAPKAMAALTTAQYSTCNAECLIHRLPGFSTFAGAGAPARANAKNPGKRWFQHSSAPLDEFLVYIKAVAASGANACKLQRSELLHELLCILCGNMSVSGNMDH